MSPNRRSSQRGTLSLATTKIQLAASSTAPPSTVTTSPIAPGRRCPTGRVRRPPVRRLTARYIGSMPFGPVDPALDLVALEERVLARWRRDDIAGQVPAARKDGDRGSSTRDRRPPTAAPACTTCGPGSSRTSTPASRPCGATACPARAAGTATACRWSSRSRRSSGLHSKHEIEAYGIAEFNQRCRESVQRYVEDWAALTERSGVWIDTDGRVLDAVQRLHRVGVVAGPPDVGQGPALRGPPGHALLRPLRHRAVVPRGRPARATSDVVDPSVYVRFPLVDATRRATPTCWCGRPRRGRCISNVAAAVGPDIAYVRVAEPGRRARPGHGRGGPAARRCAEADVARAWQRPELVGWRYQPPVRPVLPPGRAPASGWSAADFVTTDDGSGIVHLAPAFGEDDAAVGRARGPPVLNPVDADGAFDHTRPAVHGPVREGRRPRASSTTSAPAACSCAEEAYEHSYPHCWRCGTPLIYWAKTSWFVAHVRRSATSCCAENETHRLAPRAHQARPLRQVARGQRRLGAVARPLLGHAAAHLALRRAATTRASARSPSSRELTGRDLADLDLHRPYVDDVHVAVPAVRLRRTARRLAAGARRLVRLGLDAVGPAPLPVRGRRRVRRGVPGRLHLRGHRPDARLVLLAARRQHAGVRLDAVPQRRVPRPTSSTQNGQKMSKSKGNVIDPWRHLRRRTAPTRCAGTSSPPAQPWTPPPGVRGGHPRVDPPDAAHAVERASPSSSPTPTSTAGLPERPRAAAADPRARPLGPRPSSTTPSPPSPTPSSGSTRSPRPPGWRRFIDDLSNWYVRRSPAAVLEGQRPRGARHPPPRAS